jgi:glutathionyl-hydroquinone reductase
MRDKTHRRDVSHQPPTHLTADGMDAWFLQQRQRERELRQRRKEAEELLRGYRATTIDTTGFHQKEGRYSLGTPSSMYSESLHDPDKMNLAYDLEKEGEGKYDEGAKEDGAEPDDEGRGGRPPMAKSASNGKLTALSAWSPTPDEKKSEDRQSSRDALIPPQVTASRSESPARPETVWRDFISREPGAKFPPESGRYHLYVSYACPGSHRALIVRALKKLEDVISVTYCHPTWRLTNPTDPNDKHRGWVFGIPGGKPFPNTIGRGGPFPPAYRDTEPDPVFNAYSVRELYERADDNSGKYTIPLLWDKKLNTIVNNESSDIAYMLNSCFNGICTNSDLDLYTEADEEGRARLDEVSEWLAPLMIHGVYRCGFAKNQQSYDRAIGELCDAYDRADDILSRQRYLTGDTLTDADIRLFVTLIRFDEVYAFYFKANARLVMLTPSLLNFCREIYQIPGIRSTCDMEQIKAHFYGSHAEWNKYSVIPRGLGFMELLDMPHDRDELGSVYESSSYGGGSTQTPMANSYKTIGSFQEDSSSFVAVTPLPGQAATMSSSPDDYQQEQEF